jgi:flagellar biosynthesis protein FlhA
MTLAPEVESRFLGSVQAARVDGVHNGAAAPQPLVLDPKLTEQLVGKLVASAERMMKSNLLPVLLCSPELRRHIRALSERVMPHLRVLSMAEIPNNIELKSYSVVSL